MKIEKVKLFLLTLTLIFITKTVLADSPLTSTPFSDKYENLQIVMKAKNGAIDQEIADYLHSESNLIDNKAAVINALGWGKSNSSQYLNLIYNSPIEESDINTLNASEVFVIGYLNAMDNYQNPDGALPFLKRAKSLLSNSYTVNIIYNLVKAQKVMDLDFCKVWKYGNKVFTNAELEMDMREDARKIIYDYMVIYKDYCK
ncbi:MAG: hypothetical protein M3R36_08340 [Bacteroidota bacterium]|nr:hypothetical protein [Bacteroidota bacterium]